MHTGDTIVWILKYMIGPRGDETWKLRDTYVNAVIANALERHQATTSSDIKRVLSTLPQEPMSITCRMSVLSVTTTSKIKYITCDLFSNVF